MVCVFLKFSSNIKILGHAVRMTSCLEGKIYVFPESKDRQVAEGLT